MTADQIWQILTTVGGVSVIVAGAAWALASTLDSVRSSVTSSVTSLKSEVQTDIAAVRSDVSLLRTSIDGKLALAEAQTRTELVALRAIADRHAEEIAALKCPPTPARRRVAS